MTFVENHFDVSRTVEYLNAVQRNLPMIDKGCARGSTALAQMLADARLEMFGAYSSHGKDRVVDHTEIRICQASLDALKIFSLLSGPTRLALTQILYDVTMLVTTGIDGECLVDQVLEAWRQEVNDEWWWRQSCNGLDGQSQRSSPLPLPSPI